MMKRIMACLLALVCLLTAFAFAEGDTMKVIKCKQAVNLRQGPSTETASLALVPLGAVVTDCVKQGDWYSVNYEGTAGYIRGDFLELVESAPAAEQSVAEGEALQPAAQAEGTPLQPVAAEEKKESKKSDKAAETTLVDDAVDAPVASIDQPTEYNDDFTFLDTVVGNVRVIARQIYQENQEYLMVVGLDAGNNELWKKETTTDAITELAQTDAFVAGTEAAPLVLIYNACKGLTAVDPATGNVVWELPKTTLDLGGSISYQVDGNGVAYIGGYYGPDPVAIDANGNVLWQASSGSENATWLYRMEKWDNGIACYYGQMAGASYGTIVYGFDGSIVDVIYEA